MIEIKTRVWTFQPFWTYLEPVRTLFFSFCLAVYSLALVQPFLPQIAFYAQEDRLAELFCINPPDSGCNGQCYLMAQIRDQGPNQSTPLEAPQPIRSLAPHMLEADMAQPESPELFSRVWPPAAFASGESPVMAIEPPPPRV